MPLTTARITRERTLSTLVRNLFVLDGPTAAEDARRAEAAILRANPHLAERDAFRAGAVVVIPSDLGLSRTDRVAVREATPGALLEETADRIEQVRVLAEERLKREAESARAFLAQLEDPRFRRAVTAQSERAEAMLDRAKDVQSRRLDDASARIQAVAAAMSAAQEELKRLMSRARGE